jgi:hypothetical protein
VTQRADGEAAPSEWLFAIGTERLRAASGERVRALFERALAGSDWRISAARQSIVLWRFYIHYELASGDARAAMRIYFRAIRAVPWSKQLWLDGFQPELIAHITSEELNEIQHLMMEKEIRLRLTPQGE